MVVTKDSAGFQIATLQMAEVRLVVPNDVDPTNVTFTAGTDVGILENGIAPRYLPGNEGITYDVASVQGTNEVLEFNNYPNPVANGPVTVNAMVSQTQQVSIGIFNENNTLIIPVYTGELRSNSRRSFPVNFGQLAPGTYYLRLNRGGSSLSRRLVVQ